MTLPLGERRCVTSQKKKKTAEKKTNLCQNITYFNNPFCELAFIIKPTSIKKL